MMATPISWGHEFLVKTTTKGWQGEPTITELSDGRFVVAWEDDSGTYGDTSGNNVLAQVFNADGSKAGGEFRVNASTKGWQSEPTTTGLSDGRFVVAWTDYERDRRRHVKNGRAGAGLQRRWNQIGRRFPGQHDDSQSPVRPDDR